MTLPKYRVQLSATGNSEDFLREALETHLRPSMSFSSLNGSNPLTQFPLGFIFTTRNVSEYYT